jgi:hypothetical protein
MNYSSNYNCHNRNHHYRHDNKPNHCFLSLVITFLILPVHQVQASLSVNSGIDIGDLVIKLLPDDTDAIISNVRFEGDEKCKGAFSGGQSVVSYLDLAFPDEGVVLGTGNVNDLPYQSSREQTTLFGTDGDFDLEALLLPGLSNNTYDACVLEFDFDCGSESNADIISLNYVFGSD